MTHLTPRHGVTAQISQFIVARSKTAEEAYGDVWEVVMEMAGRAANRGCSVPTDGERYRCTD